MAPSRCRCCILLLALSLGCALTVSAGKWGVASYQDAVELESGRIMYQAPAPGPGHRCQWSCTGDDDVVKASGTVDAPPESIDCWGEFRFWCKAGPHAPHAATAAEVVLKDQEDSKQEWPRNATVRFWGTSCRGHFFSMAAPPPPSAPGGGARKRLVVCEGGQRVISGRVSTCPHTGDTYKSMTGSWSLGTSVAIMSAPPPSPQPSPDVDPSTPVDRSSPVDASSTASAASAAPWMQVLAAQDDLAQALTERAPNVATAADQLGGNISSGLHLEVRGEGMSGRWRATRKLDPHESLSLKQQEAEEEVEDILAPSWRDWLPHWRSESDRQHGGSTFELLCNSRPAWLHGAAPCWGNFSLLAERSCGPHPNSSTASTAPTTSSPSSSASSSSSSSSSKAHSHHAHRDSTRRSLREDVVQKDQRGAMVAHAAGATAIHAAGATASANHREHHEKMGVKKGGKSVTSGTKGVTHEAVSSRMTAECDGLWTGALGHTCHGLNIAHTEARGSSGWSSDKWSICTGHNSVHFIKRPNVWGMGTACKGKALEHMHLQWPAPTPTPSS